MQQLVSVRLIHCVTDINGVEHVHFSTFDVQLNEMYDFQSLITFVFISVAEA